MDNEQDLNGKILNNSSSWRKRFAVATSMLIIPCKVDRALFFNPYEQWEKGGGEPGCVWVSEGLVWE